MIVPVSLFAARCYAHALPGEDRNVRVGQCQEVKTEIRSYNGSNSQVSKLGKLLPVSDVEGPGCLAWNEPECSAHGMTRSLHLAPKAAPACSRWNSTGWQHLLSTHDREHSAAFASL